MARFCSLFSSSSGNCTYIGDPHGGILIDCGVSAKRTAEVLTAIGVDISTIRAIFVTHEHSDHVSGVRVFASRHSIPVYASAGTLQAMEEMKMLNGKFSAAPVPAAGMEAAGMFIRPFPLSHDARQPTGYRIETADGRSISIATDTGVVTDSILSAVSGSDLVLLESNHDIGMLQNGPYPYPLKRRILSDIGHLSNDTCAETAVQLLDSGTTRFCLAHLSHENNMRPLAYQCTRAEFDLCGAEEGSDYLLTVAGAEPEMILL